MKDDSREVVQLKETRGKTIPTSAKIRLVNGIGAIPPLARWTLETLTGSWKVPPRGLPASIINLRRTILRIVQFTYAITYDPMEKNKYPILNIKSILHFLTLTPSKFDKYFD